MGQEKNAENIPFLRSTQPKSTERVPVVELSGYYEVYGAYPCWSASLEKNGQDSSAS
jgi:hypothetical protein